jgi:two-component system, OmpR family, response regulator
MKKINAFGKRIDVIMKITRTNHRVNPYPVFTMNPLFHKPRILIVDDENDICYLLSSILRKKNIETIVASSLTEADHIIEDHKEFPLVFLDNHLPDGFGVNYIKRLKKKNPSCKVIMITAHDNITDREAARNEGADYFIGKPFSKEIILSAIEKLVV